MKSAHCKMFLYKLCSPELRILFKLFVCYFVCLSAYVLFTVITLQISRCLIVKTLCRLYWYDHSLQRIWMYSSIFSISVFTPTIILYYRIEPISRSLAAPVHFFFLLKFRRVRKTFDRRLLVSSCLSNCLSCISSAPLLDGFPWNFILATSAKICLKNSIFV